jgi:radical SAM protein with 4Fe4S-binding SPASM domain
MNYDAFMEPVGWFLTGMEKHSDAAREDLYDNEKAFDFAMRCNMARFQTSSLLTAMNELSNHDHSRFLTRTNRRVGRTETAGAAAADEGVNKAIMREAVIMQMTWPGAPCVYYGDEAGVCGWTDPDNRRTYPWGHEDAEMVRFHREMIRIHRAYRSLRVGSLVWLAEEYGLLAYARMLPGEAGTMNFFIAPYGEVYPCNGLEERFWKASMGNIHDTADFMTLWTSEQAEAVRAKVRTCPKNCWMVGTAAPVMKKYVRHPAAWALRNKWRSLLGKKPVLDKQWYDVGQDPRQGMGK